LTRLDQAHKQQTRSCLVVVAIRPVLAVLVKAVRMGQKLIVHQLAVPIKATMSLVQHTLVAEHLKVRAVKASSVQS